jgi:hypothetical protein
MQEAVTQNIPVFFFFFFENALKIQLIKGLVSSGVSRYTPVLCLEFNNLGFSLYLEKIDFSSGSLYLTENSGSAFSLSYWSD